MKKYIKIVSVSVFAFIAAFSLNVGNMNAQTVTETVVCPTGYTCVPLPSTPVNPSVPVPVPFTDATAKVTASKIELTHDSAKKEALLKGIYTVSIEGGTTGVYVYRLGGGYVFTDRKGQNSNANSQSDLGLTPLSIASSTVDQWGQTMYYVPAGQVVSFTGVRTINPNQMFAGTYYGSLLSLWVNPRSDNLDTSFNLQVSSNRSNTKTVVGETSPYILSVSGPVKPGQLVTVTGERLNSVTLNIDSSNQSTPILKVRENRTLTFVAPRLTNGQHYVTVTDKKTGLSNRGYFMVTDGVVPSVSPDLIAKIDYDTTTNSSAFVGASIAGKLENKSVSYWKLNIGCPSGVVVDTGKTANICGQDIRIDTYNMYDPTGEYLMLTASFINNSGSPATVILLLTAHDSQGREMGADKEAVQLGSGKGFYVSSVSPSFGPAGSMITINGNNFLTGSIVRISGKGYQMNMIPNSVSSTQIVTYMPSDVAPGTFDIQVSYDDTFSNTVQFTVGTPTSSSITVVNPQAGDVYDNDASQNIIVGWQPYTGDFESYRVYIGNTISNTEVLISYDPINKSSNGFSFTKSQLREFWVNLYGKTPEEIKTAYYVRVTAVKSDAVSEYIVASGKSGIFTITPLISAPTPVTVNLPPVINGITAPTSLKVGETGTWTIQATDPQLGTLSYSADWGDYVCPAGSRCAPIKITEVRAVATKTVANLLTRSKASMQSGSLTHAFSKAGTYTVKITARSSAGLTTETSTVVKVEDATRMISTSTRQTSSVWDAIKEALNL